MKGTLYEDQYAFLSYLVQFFSEWEVFQIKAVEKIKIHLLWSIFWRENCAVYEIMWKNIAEPNRPQMKIWRVRIACWIPKATNTHSKFVMFIDFFHSNSGCTKEPQCYVIRILLVLFCSIVYFSWPCSICRPQMRKARCLSYSSVVTELQITTLCDSVSYNFLISFASISICRLQPNRKSQNK